MEWLFFATKPSFLSLHPWFERVVVFFTGVWLFLLATLLLHAAMCGAAWLLGRSARFNLASSTCLHVVPAIIIGSLVIMLIDNFTYTVFRWGIVKTNLYTIPVYWVLFLVIFIFMLRRKPVPKRGLSGVAITLLAVSLVLTVWSAAASPVDSALRGIKRPARPMPNIILFASDGVNADHLSAYGYPRDTTPNLDKWLDKALVAENAFTNSAMTSGSLTAMMTSKYPATTKLFYPPQTLQGVDAYQHLPGILHHLGYESLQETIPYYADAMDLNWLGSFDYANGRKLHWSNTELAGPAQTSAQFARHVRDRVRSRAGQLLLVKPMEDKYAAVVSEQGKKGKALTDKERMDAAFDFIKRARRPFFIHIHLIGTHLNGPHCCEWHGPPTFVAAPGATPAQQDGVNLDNAILQADRYFGQMMELLRQQHLLDNTIVVYSSDHATKWAFNSTVPLVFIFPDGKDKGRISEPVQLMDVAPTLLDYMGMTVPAWMEGKSLLHDHLSFYRPIFIGYRALYRDAAAKHADIGPPLYDLEKDGLVVCDRWYVLTLANHEITQGGVSGFRGTCEASKMPDAKAAGAMMTKLLEGRGFKF
jgi:arylsulfatase A-like enzyme